jgi:hypothetical protein
MATRKKKKDNGRGGARPGAGRKAGPTGRRKLVTLRLDASVWQWLKHTAGESKLTRTELVEELIEEGIRRRSPSYLPPESF